MSNIKAEVARIKDAKASLKTAIEGKGVSVPADALIDAYPALVDAIPQGSGQESLIHEPYSNGTREMYDNVPILASYFSIWAPQSCIPIETTKRVCFRGYVKDAGAGNVGLGILYEDNSSVASIRVSGDNWYYLSVTSAPNKSVKGLGFFYGGVGNIIVKNLECIEIDD